MQNTSDVTSSFIMARKTDLYQRSFLVPKTDGNLLKFYCNIKHKMVITFCFFVLPCTPLLYRLGDTQLPRTLKKHATTHNSTAAAAVPCQPCSWPMSLGTLVVALEVRSRGRRDDGRCRARLSRLVATRRAGSSHRFGGAVQV